ncbi:hypothetical protein MSAS_24420 [Mycobacterium saskatchewanense]|uniref:hypothetical protein n=1 Tax=Mycobacterium saskatchewanense TaxID=220927 RepID=UPI00114F2128|nr:hypothetical protein [Mycobacterium saskatchewanense]BBX63268.1 hypothetical protein MSAS_24420 [Mycobacterium saskatchewanense]
MTAPNQPPAASQPPERESPSESRTRIIRRAPTGPIPTAPESPTTHIPPQPRGYQGAARAAAAPNDEPGGRTAVAACAVSIVSGWATSVVATDLIAGWWRTDRLFCIAVAFLALVFAATTVTGVIMLLQRRTLGRHLIVAGAVVAVLTYGGVFIAGARVAWIVHALPLLPIASVILALHPRTTRWLQN